MKISEKFKTSKIKSWQSLRPLVKKVLASFASVALVCSAIPLMSWAVEGGTFTQDQLTYTVLTEKAGNNTVSVKANSGNPPSGEITIPPTVTNNSITYAVTKIGDWAFSTCANLTSINIPDSVTSIGYSAFYSCSSLTSIDISNSVTSINNWTFFGCKSLTEVTIPNSVTSIGYVAFSYSGLTKITIPDSVKSIDNKAFDSCLSLTSVIIGNSVTLIGKEAFNGCTQLKFMKIPDSVTFIGALAFSECVNLKKIKIPYGFDRDLFRYSGIKVFFEDEDKDTPYSYYIATELINLSPTGKFEYYKVIKADTSTWGEAVTENEVTYYVADDGTTSAEIIGDGITWLKEESGGTSAWYGIDNKDGVFEKGSRFWVRWLNKIEDPEEWQKYYNQMDEDKKTKSSENLWIFFVGVTDRNGNKYTDFGGMEIPLYVQLGNDWTEENVNAFFISEGQDEPVGVEFIDNMDFPAGSGEFAELSLNHFSPYAVYEETNAGNNYFWLIFAAGTLLLAGGLIFILRKKAANKV